MRFPINKKIELNEIPSANRWGARRKYDIHTGLDLFCPDGTPVLAVEDGKIIDIARFTGASIGYPWWAETMCCAVEGKSGVILYGEIYNPIWDLGDEIKEGWIIGRVKTVLLKDKGLPMSMLHIELYESGYRGPWTSWNLDSPCPKGLKNIEKLLFKTE